MFLKKVTVRGGAEFEIFTTKICCGSFLPPVAE